MVWCRRSRSATVCCALLLVSGLQQLTAHQGSSASYIEAHGRHSTLAARLAELVEAEEPLNPADVARLAAAVK